MRRPTKQTEKRWSNVSGAAVLLVALPACVGGDTGDGGAGDCVYVTSSVADLDETSTLGFSARSVLDLLAKSHSTSFVWRPSAGDELTVASELSSLDLATTHAGAPVLLRQSASSDDTADCPAAFQTEVDLSFTTLGSEFVAATSVTIVAAEPGTARFGAVVPASALSARLSLGDGGTLRDLTLDGVLTSLGSYGEVKAAVGYPNDASAERIARLATWPDTSVCTADEYWSGLVVSETEDLGGFTAEDVVATFDALSPRMLTWNDGAQTDVTLSAVADGSPCASRANGWNLLQPVRISVATEDARWNGTYTGSVTTASYLGGLHAINLQAKLNSVDNTDFVAASGMPGVDVAAHEWANFELNVEFDVALGRHTGNVELSGSHRSRCSAENTRPEATNKLPPCEGVLTERLRSGRF